MSDKDAETLAKADIDVDDPFGPTSPYQVDQDKGRAALSWHFNTNGKGKTDSRMDHCNDQYNKAIKAGTKEQVLKEFGKGLHALQDMYAHMDWGEGASYILPHFALVYVTTLYFHVAGPIYLQTDIFRRDIGIFDNPDYDLTKKGGDYYSTYKGKDASQRYKDTEAVTKLWIKKIIKATGYLLLDIKMTKVELPLYVGGHITITSTKL